MRGRIRGRLSVTQLARRQTVLPVEQQTLVALEFGANLAQRCCLRQPLVRLEGQHQIAGSAVLTDKAVDASLPTNRFFVAYHGETGILQRNTCGVVLR